MNSSVARVCIPPPPTRLDPTPFGVPHLGVKGEGQGGGGWSSASPSALHFTWKFKLSNEWKHIDKDSIAVIYFIHMLNEGLKKHMKRMTRLGSV